MGVLAAVLSAASGGAADVFRRPRDGSRRASQLAAGDGPHNSAEASTIRQTDGPLQVTEGPGSAMVAMTLAAAASSAAVCVGRCCWSRERFPQRPRTTGVQAGSSCR